MEHINLRVSETDEGKFWAHEGSLSGTPPDVPLHAFLDWIIRQVRFGNATVERAKGETAPDTVVVGRQAAWAGSQAEATEQARKATQGELDPECHYALQLIEVLRDIRARALVVDAPAMKDVAAPHTLALLQEATRCYLFGLPRACVASCRAVLEDLLSERVPPFELVKEPAKAASLMRLINAAVRLGVLPVDLAGKAHGIRIKADEALHTAGTLVDDAWQLILDTRLIVDELYSSNAKR